MAVVTLMTTEACRAANWTLPSESLGDDEQGLVFLEMNGKARQSTMTTALLNAHDQEEVGAEEQEAEGVCPQRS